jgi:hypothetical protein
MPQIFSEKKRGPERKLPLIEEFFLTMVRLKVDLLVEDLAVRFSISVGSVSLHLIWMGFVQKSLCNLKLHGHLQNPSWLLIDFLSQQI